SRTPIDPNTDPTTAPEAADATPHAVTVIPHLELRLRSPSGVMLASIDSPHGDHAERMAAVTERAKASATMVGSGFIGVVHERLSGVQAGVAGADAGRIQLGVD